jgi:hypothetical protein
MLFLFYELVLKYKCKKKIETISFHCRPLNSFFKNILSLQLLIFSLERVVNICFTIRVHITSDVSKCSVNTCLFSHEFTCVYKHRTKREMIPNILHSFTMAFAPKIAVIFLLLVASLIHAESANGDLAVHDGKHMTISIKAYF